MIGKSEGIPLERDISSQLLPWLMAIMVYLVALALYAGIAMHKVAGQWDAAYNAQLTIQLPPPALALASDNATALQEAREKTLEDLLDLLLQKPGVSSARQLPQEDLNRLLEPWLSDDEGIEELPLPDLIAVTVEPDAIIDMAVLREEILALAKDAIVTDHKQGLEALFDLASWLRFVSLSIIGLVAIASVLMSVLMTKMGLAAHSRIIELLHLMGAQDDFVALQFQRHALSSSLVGGLVGLALALATFSIIDQFTAEIDHHLVPDTSLSGIQWAVFFLLPLMSTGITILTVRITVLRSLARLP